MTPSEFKAVLDAFTSLPVRYVQLVDGYEARALLDNRGYLFGQVDDLENGHAIATAVNLAPLHNELHEAVLKLKANLLKEPLLHGDAEHRAWLTSEIELVFAETDAALKALAEFPTSAAPGRREVEVPK